MGFTKAEKDTWPIGRKRCSKCLDLKPTDMFHTNNRSYLGVTSECSVCVSRRKNADGKGLRPTLAQKAAWPINHKACSRCKQVLHFKRFGAHPRGAEGLNQMCVDCRKQKASEDYAARSYERVVLDRVRSRATRLGVPFDLLLEDIVIPESCPILGIPLVRAVGLMTDNSPSVDRIIPDLGYVKGNIAIISNRANRIKTNATASEIRAVADWLDRACAGSEIAENSWLK